MGILSGQLQIKKKAKKLLHKTNQTAAFLFLGLRQFSSRNSTHSIMQTGSSYSRFLPLHHRLNMQLHWRVETKNWGWPLRGETNSNRRKKKKCSKAFYNSALCQFSLQAHPKPNTTTQTSHFTSWTCRFRHQESNNRHAKSEQFKQLHARFTKLSATLKS